MMAEWETLWMACGVECIPRSSPPRLCGSDVGGDHMLARSMPHSITKTAIATRRACGLGVQEGARTLDPNHVRGG
jgi:hypothetical protein